MTDFLMSISPFVDFFIKVYAIATAVGIVVSIAMLLLALSCVIAEERRKNHDKP